MLMTALRSMQLITGNWSFYRSDSDSKTVYPFSDRVDIGKHFFSTNFLVVSSLIVIALIWMILNIISLLTKPKDSHTEACNSTEVRKIDIATKIVYRVFLLPLSASFLMLFIISSYISNFRITTASESIFSASINSAGSMLAWLIIACSVSI
jgi:hypothetical protein